MGGRTCLADLVQFGVDFMVHLFGGVARSKVIVHDGPEPGYIAPAAFFGRQMKILRRHARRQIGVIAGIDGA